MRAVPSNAYTAVTDVMMKLNLYTPSYKTALIRSIHALFRII